VPTQVVVRARAKVNLGLEVLGRRGDGYHELSTLLCAIDLWDRVTLRRAPAGITLACDGSEVPTTEENLAWRAASLVRQEVSPGGGVGIYLRKAIPVAAGLGGGSADAAAVLRWAGELDPQVALSLGADVPFCVRGGRAAVRGVGEVVQPLPPVLRTVTLALAPFGVDTAACYRVFDALAPASRQHPRNDLTAAAELVAPQLRPVRTMLESRTGATFVLAGSGSTLYCEGDPLGLGPGGTEVVEADVGPVRLLVARTVDGVD